MKILNAFSANMLAEFPISVKFTEVSAEEVALTIVCIEADGDTIESCIGHAETAAVFSADLSSHRNGIEVPFNRVTVALAAGERALLGQYSGPRLPEGATSLPEGATIKWLIVDVGVEN